MKHQQLSSFTTSYSKMKPQANNRALMVHSYALQLPTVRLGCVGFDRPIRHMDSTQEGKGCEYLLSGVISQVESLDFYAAGPFIVLAQKRDPCHILQGMYTSPRQVTTKKTGADTPTGQAS